MKVTLGEVLDNYVVIWDHSKCMSHMYSPGRSDPNVVTIYGGDGAQYEGKFDSTQVVEPDGDEFAVMDTEGTKWYFQACKVTRLAEVPELR